MNTTDRRVSRQNFAEAGEGSTGLLLLGGPRAPRYDANRNGLVGVPYRLGSGAEFPSIVVIRNYIIAR